MTHDPTGTELNQLTFYGKEIEKTGITKIDFNEDQLSLKKKKEIHVFFFSSYLQDRTQTTLNQHVSERTITICGVPQSSVLGPLLFILHIKTSSENLQF